MAPNLQRSDPHSRLARRECLVLGALVLVFLGQTFRSSLRKSPVGDSLAHYRLGEYLMGGPAGRDPPYLDGTMPVAVVFPAAARLRAKLTSILGPPVDAFSSAGVSIPSLRWARLPTMASGVVLLVLLWLFVRRTFGALAAAGTVLVGAAEPNLIGYCRFITPDPFVTLAYFAGCFALLLYLERPATGRLGRLALILGVAQVVKTTCLLLGPVSLVAIAARQGWTLVRDGPGPGGWARAVLREAGRFVLVAFVLVAAMLAVVHVTFQALDADGNRALAHDPRVAAVVSEMAPPLWALRDVVPPAYSLVLSLGRAHNAIGHPAYLMGKRRRTGWVAYFPLAIALKTPLAVLALAAVGLAASLRRGRGRRAMLVVLGAAAAYLGSFCFLVHVNIGVRHVLPVYPAIVIAAGIGLASLLRGARRAALGPVRAALASILVLWIAHQAVMIYPHHAEYFNELAGGPENGWRYLLDSNLDWNQDAFIIDEWAAAQARPVAVNPLAPVHGLIAIQAGVLVGNNESLAAKTAWLREHYRPLRRLTPAVFVYDVP